MTSDLILNELHSNNNNTFGEDFDHSMIIDQRSQQLNDSTLIVANNSSNNNSICDVISREDATTDCSHLSSTPLSPVNSSPNSSQHVLSPSKHESHPFNVQNNGININDDSNSCKSNVTNVISVLNDFSRCDTTTTTSSDIRQTLLQTNTESNQTTNQSLTANHKRVYLDDQTLMSLSVNDYRQHWKQQELYINSIETQLKQFNRDNCDLISLRESEEKLKQQQLEANRRENILVMRLTTKEQEMQEYLNQIQELKQSQVPSNAQLQSTLVDPAVNLMFEKMKKEVELSRIKVEEMQNELKAWKFTPDSNTGKRLMAKCRLLYQENEELGKMIASGRIGKLEGELALQKNFSEEMKKSQAELDDFLLELDEDVEGMQSTIYYLQQQLKEAKEKLAKFEKETG